MASSLHNLLYHIVFSTKHREPRIKEVWKDRLYAYIGGIIRDMDGTSLATGGIEDHIHVVARLPAKLAVSEAIKTFKAKSSLWVNDEIKPGEPFYWQAGYGAFSVSPSLLPNVIAYVKNQVEHHRRMTFKEEFLKLLKRHEIEFDERYLWD